MSTQETAVLDALELVAQRAHWSLAALVNADDFVTAFVLGPDALLQQSVTERTDEALRIRWLVVNGNKRGDACRETEDDNS